jgi:hypothetical protein
MWRTDQETDFSTVIQRVMRRVTHITAAGRSFKLARLPPWPAQRSGLSSFSGAVFVAARQGRAVLVDEIDQMA